jgi:hypothetical protein
LPSRNFGVVVKAGTAGLVGIAVLSLGCAGSHRTPESFFTPACPHGLALPPDTMTVTVYLAPAPHGTRLSPRPVRPATVDAVQAIAEAFVPPRVLFLPHPISWVESAAGGQPQSFPLLAAALDLTRVRPDTQVTGRFKSETGSTALNNAIRAAIATADSLGALAKPLPGAEGDTLHIVAGGSVNPPPASTRLFVVPMRYFPLDQAVKVVEQPRPRHPAPGVEDAIDLRYVVDARGQAIPGTIEILGGKFREMAAEAVRVVSASRFTPARRRGCSIPQLVYQRIGFHTAP